MTVVLAGADLKERESSTLAALQAILLRNSAAGLGQIAGGNSAAIFPRALGGRRLPGFSFVRRGKVGKT